MQKSIKFIRGIISAILLLSGSFGAKAYIDSTNQKLSVEDVIQVIDSKGVNHGGVLHASGTIKNISDIDDVKVNIKIEFLDKDKKPLKSVEQVKEDLDAGEIWKFDVASLAKSAEYYSISYIEIEYE